MMVDVDVSMTNVECILGNKVTPIEDSFNRTENYQSVVERYYTIRYCLNIGMLFGDYCILMHSNRVCVIILAPTHALLRSGKKVVKVDFQVSKNVDRLNNRVSGKMKRGAQCLQEPSTKLFTAECADGTSFSLCAGIPGKLVEVNDALVKNPNLLVTDPQGSGYLACILPTIRNFDLFREEFLDKEQYKTERSAMDQTLD